MTTITTQQIESLRDEAAEHGDTEMANVCTLALAGDQEALDECKHVIQSARESCEIHGDAE